MRGREENLVQILALTVRPRAQQKEEQRAQDKIDRNQSCEPRAFAALQFLVKEKDHKTDGDKDKVELFNASEPKGVPKLLEIEWQVGRGMNALILPASEGVNEAGNGSWVAPLHRWVGHARQRHVEVERAPG